MTALVEVNESARLDALLLVARHLRRHSLLPEPHRITVDRVWQRIRVELLPQPDHELRDLLTWYDSLREPTAEIWSTADGSRLLVGVLGQTDDDLLIEAFAGLDYGDDLAVAPVAPEVARPMAREELEHAATACLRRAAGPADLTEPLFTGLTEAQADGLACAICGADNLRICLGHVPVGRSESGSLVFACAGRCSGRARRGGGAR